MKKVALIKNPQTQDVQMSVQNIKLSSKNQIQFYQTPQLNSVLHLQYYGFINIANIHCFKNINTLYLNNNAISKIQNLDAFIHLRTLNLSSNRIKIFEGMTNLVQMTTLDLSNNVIEQIKKSECISLHSLSVLNLVANKFVCFDCLQGLSQLHNSLTSLNISKNETLQGRAFEVLKTIPLLSVLQMSGTSFSRKTSAYRKETICALKSIVFLDDRPVTQDQRKLAQAWKQGGLPFERQVREAITINKISQSDRIYEEILKNNQIKQTKINLLFQNLSKPQFENLSRLKSILIEQLQSKDPTENKILELKIQQQQQYIRILRQAVREMDVDKELGLRQRELPKCMMQKATPQAIYVYNVAQDQIAELKAKYYSEQDRPLIAVNYDSSEAKWVQQYDAILQEAYYTSNGNLQMLIPLFNLAVYQFDLQHSRKLKRFTSQQIAVKCIELKNKEESSSKKMDELNQLD